MAEFFYLILPLAWVAMRMAFAAVATVRVLRVKRGADVPIHPDGNFDFSGSGCLWAIASMPFGALLMIPRSGPLGPWKGGLSGAFLAILFETTISLCQKFFVTWFFSRRLPRFIEGLESKDSEHRYICALAVMGISLYKGSITPNLTDRLNQLLRDPELKVRVPAGLALVRLERAEPSEVIVQMVSSLWSDDHSVRPLLSWFFEGFSHGLIHLVIDELLRLVAVNGENYPPVVNGAMRQVDAYCIPALQAALEHPSPQVRYVAELGLKNLR